MVKFSQILKVLSLKICLSLFTTSCTSALPKRSLTESNFKKAISLKKESLKGKSKPLKGKFLDYLYKISPGHKQEGHGFNTNKSYNGYAFGYGYYDGWFSEYYLFRGEEKDLVFQVISGYETSPDKRLYGYELNQYSFKDDRMTKRKLEDLLPLNEVEKLFSKKILSLKRIAFYNGWELFRLIKFPELGTTIKLKLCKNNQSPYFDHSQKTLCITIGTLDWDKEKFTLKPTNNSSKTEETI